MEVQKIKEAIKSKVTFTTSLYIIIFIIIISFILNKNSIIYNGKDSTIHEVSESYKFNLESDVNRLECVFEHRRCLYNNIGVDKDTVLKSCFDLNYCDEKYLNSK